MDKKIKFSDKPLSVKIVYIATLAILVICAVVVTVVSIASRKDEAVKEPPISQAPTEDENAPAPDQSEDVKEPEKKPEEEKLTFSFPVVGTVIKSHSLSETVFSETLGEWRTHKGIDIATDESCAVYAAEKGVISAIYDDPFHGRTVEITHSMNFKTIYSNLAKEDSAFVKVGDKVNSGDRIGTVGYTAIFEIADEPHLHFEMESNNKAVDPLKYLKTEDKNSSV